MLFIPPGTSIRRHRITLPPPDEDQFYTVYHFNIDADVVFYGRKFKIYDCDIFTKNFLKKIGIKLNPPLPRPVDPYMKMRREVRSGTLVTSCGPANECWHSCCRHRRTLETVVMSCSLDRKEDWMVAAEQEWLPTGTPPCWLLSPSPPAFWSPCFSYRSI